MMRFFIFLYLFCSTTLVFSQTITGKVVSESGEALVGATILQDGTQNGVSSSDDGLFSLSLISGKKSITISFLGYVSESINVPNSKTVQVVLKTKSDELSQVVVVGSRSASNRTVTNSAVPVDVISLKDINTTNPFLSVNDVLNYIVPSFNSNTQSASDGTEHIDPASLRGLGPDQVLVLINGKRRHTTSLVNYQNTVGNGSVGTDLNAIPAIAIDKIEVLRDGAAAQYGSDAIAGVINIVLKKNTGFIANATAGTTSRGDGKVLDFNGSYGISLKDKGYLNISTMVNSKGATDRSQNHNLIIFDQSSIENYFSYDFTKDAAASRAFDDAMLKQKGLSRDAFNFHVGDAAINNIQSFLNFGYNVKPNIEVYAFGGMSNRKGTGYPFRRLPSETNHVVSTIFPNGFQPNLKSNINDYSFAAGAKFKFGKLSMVDISNIIGSNSFDYTVVNTNNVYLGASSPTSFNAGEHSFLQNTTNIDFSTFFPNALNGVNLASGLENRYEKFQIIAGEKGSYITDPSGNIAGGAQSFPGFSPTNEVNQNRNSKAIYLDLEGNLTKKWLLSIAGRFEDYSDFGNTFNTKYATRYAISDKFNFRAAYSTGFRAPSLQQRYFNNTSTDINNGELTNNAIFRNDSPVAKLLNIPSLKQETSKNYSFGFTASPNKSWSITVDAYQIEVNDRIALSGYFGSDPYGGKIDSLSNLFKPYGGATAGRFFINGINTRTQGIDLVVTNRANIGKGKLTSTLSANYNKNVVVSVAQLSKELKGQEDVYFGPDQRSLIESNSPRLKGTLQFLYNLNNWNVMLRNTYFGEVTRNGFPFGIEQLHRGKVVTDLTVSYKVNKEFNITLGANNLLDIFPDVQTYENSYFGVFKYAPVQMGTKGTYMFARLTYNFK